MSGPPKSVANPAVAALLRSTTWKLLIAADVVACGAGVVGYYFTQNFLVFAPMAVVATAMPLAILRASKQTPTSTPADDSIVK